MGVETSRSSHLTDFNKMLTLFTFTFEERRIRPPNNALYLMPFTFCYNMIMMHMHLYFDIMYDCYRAEITYIQYSFTCVVVPKQYYLTLYVYLLLCHGK